MFLSDSWSAQILGDTLSVTSFIVSPATERGPLILTASTHSSTFAIKIYHSFIHCRNCLEEITQHLVLLQFTYLSSIDRRSKNNEKKLQLPLSPRAAPFTMAANDYYASNHYGNPPRYDEVSDHDSFRRHAATPASHVSPYEASEPDLRHPEHSHQTLASDPSAYPTAARANEHDYYSENIPLNTHNHYANGPPPEWMRQPTHYPPSPEMMEVPIDGEGRKKKKGFFKKKLPWVTYTLTVVQIVVFIVELVKNGMCDWTWLECARLTEDVL